MKIKPGMKVNEQPCKTCPFAGTEPCELSHTAYLDYYNRLVTLQSQHICHSTNNETICRGGRDIQLQIMHRLGLIPEPTDAAFDAESKKLLGTR